jgi:hypothetical protein
MKLPVTDCKHFWVSDNLNAIQLTSYLSVMTCIQCIFIPVHLESGGRYSLLAVSLPIAAWTAFN